MSHSREELLAKAKKYLSGHYNPFYPEVVFVNGDGSEIWDSEGKKYLDFTSGESFFNFGRYYNSKHALVANAIYEEFDNGLVQMCGCNFYYPSQILLAEALCKTMPQEYEWSAFFTNSGAESIDGALKLALYATGKTTFIAFDGAFHGRTLAATALTHSNHTQQEGFSLDAIFDSDFVQHCSFGDIQGLANIVESCFPVAGIILEPIQGYGGVNPAPKGFLQDVRKLCDDSGALMIVDEIQSGLGRSGKMWAFEHDNIAPDIVCSAKALGGGLPLGAVIARKDLLDTWKPGSHGSSGGGNAVACAAGADVLSLINENTLEYVKETGFWFMSELQKEIFNVRVTGLGFMIGIEFESTLIRNAVMREAGERGLLVLRANRGYQDRSIRLLPPLNATRDELARAVSILKQSVLAHLMQSI